MITSTLSKDDIERLKETIDIYASIKSELCIRKQGIPYYCDSCPISFHRFDKTKFLEDSGSMEVIGVCVEVLTYLLSKGIFKDSKTFLERHNEGLENAT